MSGPARDDRLRAILEIVETSGRPVTVDHLAGQLGVAAATIRRDAAV